MSELAWLEHGFGTRLSSDWPDGAGAALSTVRQIHSAKVLRADRAGLVGEGDALISNQAGLTLAVRTADCLPVLMADSKNRAVAAVHAGWRGVVQEIVPTAMDALAHQFGTRPEDLTVAIGPGIAACCFEVGPEVALQFSDLFPERRDLTEQTHVDLVDAVLRQLGRSGVRSGQIDASGLCTGCHGNLFHSYRRDRDAAGRMVSAIGIRSGVARKSTKARA